MQKYSADNTLVDNRKLSKQIRLGRFRKVLKLIGTSTLTDSLRLTKPGEIVSNTGIAGKP